MFSALIVDESSTSSTVIRDALEDAGCFDVVAGSRDQAMAILQARSGRPDLVVVNIVEGDLAGLQHLVRAAIDLPFLVVCDERHVDTVLLAGAAECVTTPLRPRELVARIRVAVRDGARIRHLSHRERRMSDAIHALEREKEDLERMICVDPLTGIANRRYALSLLEAEWRRSARDQSPLGLVMVDLDCYHAYNERYGHLGGDACLARVSEAMVRCLRRPSDVLGRYGGEEFIAVLPHTDAAGAKIVAERLRSAVEALAIPHAGSTCASVVTITAGFGAVRATAEPNMTRLIAVADGALLQAKATGRNRIAGDAPSIAPSSVSALRWQRFEPVLADPCFADRIPAFLADATTGATAIVQALRDDDAVRIARTAATLKAGARALGLPLVETLAVDLERAAAARDVGRTRHAADELVQYTTHVQVIYRRATGTGTLPILATS